MKERLEFIKKEWASANKAKKIGGLFGSVIGITLIVIIIIRFFIEIREVWRSNRVMILSLFILLMYLYPLLYSFFSDIHKKDKEIMEIIKKDNNKEIIQELESV